MPKELTDLYAIFTNHPEGRWILWPERGLPLYNTVKKLQPKNVLELGGGIGAGTAVISLALGDGPASPQSQGGRITSVEQYEKCLNIAKEIIPAHLQKKINFVLSDTYAFKNDKISKYQYLSGYKNLGLNDSPFDFVVVDGPASWMEDGQLVALPHGDIITALPHLVPGCKIFFDGRKITAKMLLRYLPKYLKIYGEDKHYIILERTNHSIKNLDELEVTDQKLANMENRNYFGELAE